MSQDQRTDARQGLETGDAEKMAQKLAQWEGYRADMADRERRMCKLAKNFLDLGDYESALRCAAYAEGCKIVIGRMPSPL